MGPMGSMHGREARGVRTRPCDQAEKWTQSQPRQELGCTFDYFSRAGLAMGEWLRFAAEHRPQIVLASAREA